MPSDMLSVPLKRTSDIDVTKPLRHLIASTYSSSDAPAQMFEKLKEFQKLRQSAIKTQDRGESASIAIANYYDQIASLEQKIPSHEVQVAFKWKDAFDRGSLFGGRISLTVSSLGYEKICVLFNLGAIQSMVASDQNMDSDDGMQKAMKKFQLAAGIFGHLKNTVVGVIQTDPTPDLEPDTLAVLSDLMLAQAQEMVVCKAIHDKMKDAIIAKLCAQCEDLFAIVMRSIQKENVRNVWEASWIPNVCGKQAIYNGLAQYHQSKVCNASKSVGEEIARLEYAQTLFNIGMDRCGSGDLCHCKEWLKRTQRALEDARKDNDFIYHERIPETKNLAAIAKAPVAKATHPLPTKFGSQQQEDLFGELCPVAVHQALATFDGRKQEVVNAELGKLKDNTNALNETLSSLNLPAALEDTSGSSVPGSLVSKANMVRDAGGLSTVSKLMGELPELLTRNTEILDECERMLKEEKESDSQLRNQFKEKWTRTSSEQLTGTFDTNANKYRTIINNAKQADAVVKEKLQTHLNGIEMLSKGGESLSAAIPSSGTSAVKGSPTVTKLKSLVEDVETLKAERQVMEAELKEAKFDMKSIFFDALNRQGTINESDLSSEALDRVFGPLRRQVGDSISRQDAMVKDIRQHHDKFVQESGGGAGSSNAREEKLKELAAAHDAFFELRGNLQEGTKFYNDLTQLLVTFQNKVSDFCFARRTEKEELMKDLTSGMASMSMSNAPTPPSHHSATTTTNPERPPRKNDPPPRPPQPAENPYAGAPTTQEQQPIAPTAAPGAPPAPATPAAPTAANPYAGAPPQPANPYPGAPYPPPGGAVAMPYPTYTPMPAGYNPYYGGGVPAYPAYPPQQPPAGYPPYPAYQLPQAGYPPYSTQQQQWPRPQ